MRGAETELRDGGWEVLRSQYKKLNSRGNFGACKEKHTHKTTVTVKSEEVRG